MIIGRTVNDVAGKLQSRPGKPISRLNGVSDVSVTMQAMEAAEISEPFEAFYRREFAPMVRLAAAVSGNHLVAEDIAQEAMIRAHRHWETISQYDKPGAWLRRVTINLATSSRSRLASEVKVRLRLGPPPTVPPPAEPHDEVWQAVRRLPGKQRAAVALHYLEDRSVAEIAGLIDCSESTAKVHLHRGRTALGQMLEGQR
jgi:RNA polymerase sigma-70 factor (ECF subfamily)